MSSISVDVPTLQVNDNDLQNLLSFIYKHEQILKEYGAIKIQPNKDCRLALKKRQKNLVLYPNMEQIIKIPGNEPIYSVRKVNYIDEFVEKNSLVADECSFWSSLPRSSNERHPMNTSLLSNKSFFSQKTSRIYFDIQRLPRQSLLKMGGNKVTRQFVPCVRRAHGPGAIFPLSCAKQRLFSIDYLHEGGAHHWYIIPTYERATLQQLMKQKYSSSCLDHGQILIDPSVLDKNHIRYHRIIQGPNEFVVLFAGTLAQSFTEDASWSESVVFALPSWIEEGHAAACSTSCQCDIPQQFLSQQIDFTLFKKELIEKYISCHLNITVDHKLLSFKGTPSYLEEFLYIVCITSDYNCTSTVNQSMPNSTSSNSSNAETVISPSMDLFEMPQSIVSSLQASSSSSRTPPSSCYFFEDDKTNYYEKNSGLQYKILQEDTIFDAHDAALIDFISNEYMLESNVQASQFDLTNTSSANMHQDATYNRNMDDDLMYYEELLNFLNFTDDNIVSTFEQVNENIDMNDSYNVSSDAHITEINKKQNDIQKKQSLHRVTAEDTTLFVSGLRNSVTKDDIRKHFIGCTQVTLKQCRGTSHLKYAFVQHGTSLDAKHNLQRPIDYYCLGPECHIEYSKNHSTVSSNYQIFDKKKLTIRGIPETVNKNDLRRLFSNAHVLKYCPARNIQLSSTEQETNKKTHKILKGYAVLLYDNEQQAANVLEHANQYKINGQSLIISLYRNKITHHNQSKSTDGETLFV